MLRIGANNMTQSRRQWVHQYQQQQMPQSQAQFTHNQYHQHQQQMNELQRRQILNQRAQQMQQRGHPQMRIPQQRQGGNMNPFMTTKANQNKKALNLANFNNFVASYNGQ